MAVKEQVKNVRVKATARGFDGICVREPGDEFDMPETVFAPRPKRDDKGKVVPDEFYDAPSWFEKAGKPAQTGPASGTDSPDRPLLR
jgi:hypothetical protein